MARPNDAGGGFWGGWLGMGGGGDGGRAGGDQPAPAAPPEFSLAELKRAHATLLVRLVAGKAVADSGGGGNGAH